MSLRVVSLVPSWTETLLRCGVNVVGRTRFCIHPRLEVDPIAIVGGTKEVDWEKVRALTPDFVLMDKEENTFEMASASPFPLLITHIGHLQDMPRELEMLATTLQNEKLRELKNRWENIINSKPHTISLDPPATLEFLRRDHINELGDLKKYDQHVYVIWKNPWMAATGPTFIGSVCEWLGWKLWTYSNPNEKYPEFQPHQFQNQNVLFLCSSEPYPFLKRKDSTLELPGDVAIVDGECLSWFGIRSLEFLEASL